jgi:hypothetical protein
MSSIARVLHVHTTTWDFTSSLLVRFSISPEEVKEAIMTDINDLVQSSRISSDEASFFAMRRLKFCRGVLIISKYVLILFLFLGLPST